MEKIKATIIAEKVSTNSSDAKTLFSKQRLGEKDGEKIIYSLPETLFLIETKKLELYDSRDKKLSEKEVQKKFQRIDKKFKNKYAVFKDLRKQGYIVKTALKFGADFRVYEKGKSIGRDHSKWVLYVTSENEDFTWHEFSAKNRVAHSTKKNLLIGVVDEENDVSYYEVSWKKI